MIDQFHDDNLPLDPQYRFVVLRTGFSDRHPGGEQERVFWNNLDSGILTSLGVFGNLHSTWAWVSASCRIVQESTYH
jgi:hypothetical protein